MSIETGTGYLLDVCTSLKSYRNYKYLQMNFQFSFTLHCAFKKYAIKYFVIVKYHYTIYEATKVIKKHYAI